ncbi:MAG: tetratricopeptide repeat protein [Bacteroidales bacterium]|nr:tetratricopeptide repeat protein [Bacteroidales bacterium]
MLFFMCGAAVYAQVEQKYLRRGNKDFREHHYHEAEINYRRALEKNSGSAKANYNLGNAMYKQDQYEAAASRYNMLLHQSDDIAESAKYFYNLGNSLYKSQKYAESVSAYKNALLIRPDDMDAKHNLQMALRMLQEQNQSGRPDRRDNRDEENQSDSNPENNQQQDQQSVEDQHMQDPGKDEQRKDPADVPQSSRGQISPEDAERLLQALENEEKNVLKKVQERQMQIKKVPVEKNW